MNQYVGIVGTVAILAGALAAYCDIAMRAGVNERLPQDMRFYWWRANFSTMRQCRRKYRESFPGSIMPSIWRLSLLLAVAGFVLFVKLSR
jgi:hypothetical protein